MATTVTSVRVVEEQFEEFKEMQKELGGGAEFSSWALEMFKMHQSSKTSDQFSRDIQDIEKMMESIAGAVNGIVSRAEGAVIAKGESIKEELRVKDQESEELKTELELLREELKKKDEEIFNREAVIKDVQKELKDNKEILEKTQKDFITTSKLNEMLMGEKERYQVIESNNEQLATDNKVLTEKLEEVKKQANETMQKITALDKEKQESEQKHVETITSLKDKHKQALEHAEALKSVAVKEAKADVREEAQAKIEVHLQTENQLRKEIDSARKELEDSRKQVYTANNTMEELKNANSKEVSDLKREIEQLKAKVAANQETPTEETKTDNPKRVKSSRVNTETNTDK